MSVHLKDPRQITWDTRHDIPQNAGEFRELVFAFITQLIGPAAEQHLGLEHEPVADDREVRSIAQDLPQAAEKFGAVGGELFHFCRERQV